MTHSIGEGGWGKKGKDRMGVKEDEGSGGLGGCECCSAHSCRGNQW